MEHGLSVPKLYTFAFGLLDHGKKGFVCEHDLFFLMQYLRQTELAQGEMPALTAYVDESLKLLGAMRFASK